MPRPKKNDSQASQLIASDEEPSQMDETQPSQATQSGTQAQKAVDKMSEQEFNRKVADLVRYLLFAARKKIPIKKPDLLKNVMKEHSRAFAKVMEEARKQLNDVFGFQVEELIDREGKLKGYVLMNGLLSQHEGLQIDSKEDATSNGLLMIVLCLIYMNEGHLTEASLWYTLRKFGVEKDRPHNVFGDAQKLIDTDFTKQMFIERTKVTNPDGISYVYGMGLRTGKEIGDRKLLRFVADMYGNELTDWKTQYADLPSNGAEGDDVMQVE